MSVKSTADIQSALVAAGLDLGQSGPKGDGVDGSWGRLSIAALTRFQVSRRLSATGSLDPATLAVLFPEPTGTTPTAHPAWYREADRLQGVRETPGSASNPAILGWAKKLGGWVAGFYRGDDIPWCGLFVGHVVGQTLPAEALPSNPLSALAWAKFGVPLSRPAIGAVLVFSRKGGGHVGFYAGEDATALHVLGGNQSDRVNVARISSDRLVGVRWPSTAPLPSTGRLARAGSGALSRNEA